MAEGHERAGEPAGAAAELKDRGALGNRRVNDVRLISGRKAEVHLDRTAVRSDIRLDAATHHRRSYVVEAVPHWWAR